MQKNDYQKLLRCPFCGSEAKYENIDGYHYIICDECGARNFGFSKESAFDEWNSRVQIDDDEINYPVFPDSSKVNQPVQVPEVVENGNCEYLPDECCKKSCKEENATLEFLIPKWRTKQNGYYILEIPITQADRIRFTITHTDGSSNFIYQLQLEISLWGHISYLVEECGQFNTLNEAKQKANKCIRELGERLVYFANNIKTEE